MTKYRIKLTALALVSQTHYVEASSAEVAE